MNLLIVFSVLIFLLVAAFIGIVAIRRNRRSRTKIERRIKELNDRLKTAFEQLEEQKTRIETTFSGMTEGVLMTDQRGDILHINPAFQEMFDLPKKVDGRSSLQVLANVACDDAIHEVIKTAQPVEREIIFERPARRVFQVHFSPMRRDGKLFGVVSVFHDLTEIRRLEQIRRDFIANLSHELKTPLTAIRGFSETLLDQPQAGPEFTQKYLEIIFRHAADLSHLMDNLLNLSKIESGKEEVLYEGVSLKHFVDRLLERFATQASVKKIKIHNEILETKEMLQADPTKLNQILTNLLDNALKYTPEQGQIWIRGSRDDPADRPYYIIEVEDTGPGISKQDQERIFERFYRVDKARSRDTGGAGLGLSIVKHLVELHGGEISVESVPGRGSKFKIIFPQAVAAPRS